MHTYNLRSRSVPRTQVPKKANPFSIELTQLSKSQPDELTQVALYHPTNPSQKASEGAVDANNARHGDWTYWYNDGKLCQKITYDHGVRVKQTEFKLDGSVHEFTYRYVTPTVLEVDQLKNGVVMKGVYYLHSDNKTVTKIDTTDAPTKVDTYMSYLFDKEFF